MLHRVMSLYQSLYKDGRKMQVDLYRAIGKHISKSRVQR